MKGEVLHQRGERVGGILEKALVIQENEGFSQIEHNEALITAFQELGLTPADFQILVRGEFEDVSTPAHEILTDGEIREDVTVRMAQIGDRQVEVSSGRRNNSAQMPSVFEMQLRQNPDEPPAYKILVGLQGNATLRFPKTTIPGEMDYGAIEAGENIAFGKGTIAIIHAPTAWALFATQKDFSYLYISSPRHNYPQDTLAANPTS